jgi:hypothetical protein
MLISLGACGQPAADSPAAQVALVRLRKSKASPGHHVSEIVARDIPIANGLD